METRTLEPINTEHMGWLEALKRIADTTHDRVPRVLLVDDDPIFCKAAAQLAKVRGLSLTICRSFGELFQVSKNTFDVAVLDYSFGDFTALQIAPMLRDNTPLLLISGMSRSEVHYADWPLAIEAFISKDMGLENIFRRAMQISKFGEPPTGFGSSGWMLLWATITAVGLGVLFFSSNSGMTWRRIRWDAIDINRSLAVDTQEAFYELQAWAV